MFATNSSISTRAPYYSGYSRVVFAAFWIVFILLVMASCSTPDDLLIDGPVLFSDSFDRYDSSVCLNEGDIIAMV